MADLVETSQWDAGIYQLETTDEILGGANGIDNLQAKQLGNRTQWLKAVINNAVIAAGLAPDDADLNLLAQAIAEAGAGAGGRVLGEPFWHFGESPPIGAMEFKQQILNRVTYSDLWDSLNDPDRHITWIDSANAAIYPGRWHTGDDSTTFGVPVLDDVFLQVWNSTLSGLREFGSFQEAKSQRLGAVYTGPGGAVTGTQFLPSDGSFTALMKSGRSVDGTDQGMKFQLTTDKTRPDNVVLMLCFWYQY